MEEAVLMGQGEGPEAGSVVVTAAPEAGAGAVGALHRPAVPPTPATPLARARASIPRWVHLPYGIVAAGTAGGLGWTSLGTRHVEAGMLAVAAAMLAAAVLRLVLPERRAGLLLSRRRVLDVLVLASLGASIMAVVLVLPSPA